MTMDALNTIFATVTIIIIIFLLSLIPYSIGRNWGYKAGQIDALTGSIYYKLEKQGNSEFIWVECPSICRYEKQEDSSK